MCLALAVAVNLMSKLPVTSADLEDQAVRSTIDRYVRDGQLPLQALTDKASQPKQWTLQAFKDYFLGASKMAPAATNPGGSGPAKSMADAWADEAKDRLRRGEGFRPEVYPDANKGMAAPTIGYGFNLAPKTLGREAMKAALNIDDRGVDEYASRKRRLTQDQSEKVLDVAVQMAGSQVERELGGKPVHAQAKAALVDLVYNSGAPAVKARGIFDAVKRGDMAAAITNILSWKDRQTHVNERRRYAALDLVAGDFQHYRHLFD